MKRSLPAFLIALLVLFASADASAWSWRKPRKQPKEIELQVERESESEDRDAPKRVTAPVSPGKKQVGTNEGNPGQGKKPVKAGPPVERELKKAKGRVFDVRKLPKKKPRERERPEHEGPTPQPTLIQPDGAKMPAATAADSFRPVATAVAPAPIIDFDGLDRESWGSGSPPDTTGDVGPTYYIQSVNASVGIYRKSDGFQEAAFTFDTLMSQGNFGNQCDTDNFGDPVVLYDTFEDRWILTDFAFTLDGGGNVNPQEAFQCFAVSMNGNPLTGGWNFYSIRLTDGLNDYPKLGVWTDGIYMSANMFGYPSGAPFQGVRVWALNKQQMYAGSATVQVVSFDVSTDDFTVIPSNARLQTGTPPVGTPNYFISTWNYLNAVSVYKFHVDWDSTSQSTFTGPDLPLADASWPNASVANAPQSGTATLLDVLQIRAMVQNQYTNLGGVESLWTTHTVRRANTTGFAAPRWYEVEVTGGTVAAETSQSATWDPDGANVLHRFMPSLAVDRAGNLAMGYSTSSSTTFPSIMYAGRLATDPDNTFSYTEQTLFSGTASQTGSSRWGDYSSVMLDPDGCTFWITNQYANPVSQTFDKRWKTRIGAFRFPECTMVGAGGTISGTVTALSGGDPLSGATVQLGARTTTTDGSGAYSFTVPAGTYPSITASFPGYDSVSVTDVVVTDDGTTTQDFALPSAATAACPADTTQSDFLIGVGTNVDVTTSPGDVTLLDAPSVDQQNTTIGNSGVGITTTTWGGQTFTPGVTGTMPRVDINLFCSGCTGTTPNLTLSLRATSGGLPAGADLATATVAGFNSGSAGYYTATFATPPALTGGTQYALVIRPTANPSPGTYALTRSGTSTVGSDVYGGGTRVSGPTSGTVWSVPLTGGISTDAGFKIYIRTGFAASGDFVSSTKDSNPLAGLTPVWSTLTWTATVPTNTSLEFQVAGSASPSGPFNFVGPDGTAATFFTTSGASLSQFFGSRYLQYKAYLASTDSTQSPTLSDVEVCYTNTDCSAVAATITPDAAQVCTLSEGNGASGPAGLAEYQWSIANGTIEGSATSQSVSFTAGATGNVTLTLTVIAASGCQATTSVDIPILVVPTPTITPGGPETICAGGGVLLTSSSATGNQWYLDGDPLAGETNQTLNATAAGAYTVIVTESGCESEPSAATNVSVDPLPATPAITPDGPTTFCDGGSVTLTSSSATGNQWYLDGDPIGGATAQQYVATASGDYTVVVTEGTCPSAPSSAASVVVNPIPATPTITPGGPTTFCDGDSVTLTSSSASGNQWYLDGDPIADATSQQYVATASGSYTVVVTLSGCASSASAGTAVLVNPIPATPAITPGGPTTFCAGGSVTLTSSSESGNQWYLDGDPIGGAVGPQYVATATGSYTVTVTDLGCESAPATPVAVTVNANPISPVLGTAITPIGQNYQTICAGSSIEIRSTAPALTLQWYLSGEPIDGANGQNYVATLPGTYTLSVTDGNGCSTTSGGFTILVQSLPETPAITPGGPTTFCIGDSVTLTSSSATGNQWYLDGDPIGGATAQQYVATGSGDYTVVVTGLSSCESAPSPAVSVVVNATLPPSITPGGPTTFCAGGSVTLTSSSPSGNQWYLDGNPIGGATAQQYVATAAGDYTVVTTTNSCPSAPSSAITIAITPAPLTPSVTPGGPTTFCAGGSVTLTSDSASGNQWYLDGSPIGNATAQQYVATASGDYTVVVTQSGCPSAPSSAVAVTAENPPATPAITPSGPTSFCTGGSVTLTSSSASGNQWLLNGAPIDGQTSQTLLVTATGDYSVTVTAGTCEVTSAATTVTLNADPNATITAAAAVVAGSGNLASVPDAGAGAIYSWSIVNGTITAGAGTPNITFLAGAAGTLTLDVTVTTGAGCSASSSASIDVALPSVTVASVTPDHGSTLGGTAVTIAGTGFLAGATVTFGGTAATNVVVASATQITATTPAHAAGAVNVTVTNADTAAGTLNNGYTYDQQNFDPNGDSVIDPSDIFYLVAYLFLDGPPPAGVAGMPSGDANGDGIVDPADIFYAVHYLFGDGPAPHALPGQVATSSAREAIRGAVSLGRAVRRGDRWFVPVIVSADPGSVAPRSLALRVKLGGEVADAVLHRGAGLEPAFEISRRTADALTYLVSFSGSNPMLAGDARSATVAEIEISAPGMVRVEIDPELTMLVGSDATSKATVGTRTLRVNAAVVGRAGATPAGRTNEY